ncbi:xanthine dehydrogenase accessory protein XdhC [Pandoraea pnomenusa]|uniref:xanthine dehydrogenase accessory protein XdhC n=1 Tax=Pandoraea pnomenusa TaxID=93220 RepID=UPI0003D2048D|nr:xanthine dehydrogenase accessory protein XdhC [Pandoraea pnomenusa]AHB74440.1 xanthine dehydrogenase accessory protein XdhC [Pandoraea pnomenusa]
MHRWVDAAHKLLARGEAAVLVTIARVEGSAPREAGTHLLVTREHVWETIGGGHLEWKAMEVARTLLRQYGQQGARHVERFALGPSLGQCCGGAVTLAFEVLTLTDLAWVSALHKRLAAGEASLRSVAFGAPGANAAASQQQGGPVMLTGLDPDEPLAHPHTLTRDADDAACSFWQGSDGWLWLSERLAPSDFHIVLFGAGHVGQAIVQVLATLPCRVTWADERTETFPETVPANTVVESTDTPEALVTEAPPGAYFLVMTHNHALDQRLCEAIFRRDDFAYFGLIGSMTKRRQFEHRLRERGVSAERLEQMICPVGVAGISGKAPATIAIAVAAQLLRVREQQMRLGAGAPSPVAGAPT